MLGEIMTTDRKLKIVFGLLSLGLLVTLIVKLTNVPGGMILSGLFLGGVLLFGILIGSLILAGILKLVFKKSSFLTLLSIVTTIVFICFHYYLYSPTLKIIVPNGYTGAVNLVLSNVGDNILTVDSNGIGYLNKWTFEKTYSKPIVQQANGRSLDSDCVGFNSSTFWGYSKFCCVAGKSIRSLSFDIERKNDGEQNKFQAKGFAQYVDTTKIFDK